MAEQTQLSTALISQLERDLANPTLSVLQILANTLGISITELLAEDIEEESLVLRASDREKSFYNDSDLKSYHYILTPEEMKSNLRLALVHIEPRSETLSGEFLFIKMMKLSLYYLDTLQPFMRIQRLFYMKVIP